MHIGIVDDNPSVLAMIEAALKLHGHSSETFSNSSSFLYALHVARREPPYDVVIVDLFLDHLSGIDIIEVLQAQRSQLIPTILISAAEETTLTPIRQRYPVVPIMQKPFSMRTLLSLVDKVTSRVNV
ncbi:MAG TPA: response regulator [Ktedonobacteraceae bacterium]|jgi:DNA-binding response OmpR family regulator|nr:response regulator [Ktedonobacteraceae bacterium]